MAHDTSVAHESHVSDGRCVVATSALSPSGTDNNSSSSPSSSGWSETALEWWQRSRQQRIIAQPKHPSAAARAWVQRPRLAFLQGRPEGGRHSNKRARLESRPPQRLLPLVELSGSIGKTWTLLTLAVDFVVQTRPSRFAEFTSNDDTMMTVFILDAHWEISATMIYKLIRSMLLCDYDNMATDVPPKDGPKATQHHAYNNEHDDLERRLAADCESCLQRVQVAHADENCSAGWLPILEGLVTHLAQVQQKHPTLVLWDGLLGGRTAQKESSATRDSTDLQRTLLRLLREYQVMMVYTTTTTYSTKSTCRPKGEWDDRVTHRVRFDHVPAESLSSSSSHPFVAHTKEDVIPFSITQVGVRT